MLALTRARLLVLTSVRLLVLTRVLLLVFTAQSYNNFLFDRHYHPKNIERYSLCMSIIRCSSSLIVELLYLGYHVLDFLIDFQKVGIIEDALTSPNGREVVELRQRILGISLLLFDNLSIPNDNV